MIIAMNTGQRWAFGVDEDTAYVWRPSGVYEIVGEALRDGVRGGVVVYQDTIGTPEVQSALMHFLTEGDQINPSTGEVIWNPEKSPCDEGPLPDSSDSVFTGVNYRTISLGVAQGPEGIPLSTYHGNRKYTSNLTQSAFIYWSISDSTFLRYSHCPWQPRSRSSS